MKTPALTICNLITTLVAGLVTHSVHAHPDPDLAAPHEAPAAVCINKPQTNQALATTDTAAAPPPLIDIPTPTVIFETSQIDTNMSAPELADLRGHPSVEDHADHQTYTSATQISIVGADGKEHPLSIEPGAANAENIAQALRAQHVPEALVLSLTPTILEVLAEQPPAADLPPDLLERLKPTSPTDGSCQTTAPQRTIANKLDLILDRLDRLEQRIEMLQDRG